MITSMFTLLDLNIRKKIAPLNTQKAKKKSNSDRPLNITIASTKKSNSDRFAKS